MSINDLVNENFGNHVDRNKTKYTIGAGAAAGGLTGYAAANPNKVKNMVNAVKSHFNQPNNLQNKVAAGVNNVKNSVSGTVNTPTSNTSSVGSGSNLAQRAKNTIDNHYANANKSGGIGSLVKDNKSTAQKMVDAEQQHKMHNWRLHSPEIKSQPQPSLQNNIRKVGSTVNKKVDQDRDHSSQNLAQRGLEYGRNLIHKGLKAGGEFVSDVKKRLAAQSGNVEKRMQDMYDAGSAVNTGSGAGAAAKGVTKGAKKLHQTFMT